MPEKPTRASGYPSEQVELVRSTCLYVATKLGDLMDETGMPVALDETMVEEPELMYSIEPWVDAVVLKPTLLGGFEVARELAAGAESLGIEVVVSSSFESGVGLSAMAHLAAGIDPDIAHGLGTHEWLAEDVLERQVEVAGGRMNIGQAAGELALNAVVLEEVYHS